MPASPRPHSSSARRLLAPSAVCLALLGLVGWRVWAGIETLKGTTAVLVVPAAVDMTPAATRDLAAIGALGLFGADRAGAMAAAPDAATPTALALRLEGVILGSEPHASRAIIVAQGQQRTYAVGDTLPGQGRILLRAVEAARVIIDNNGSVESLGLFEPVAVGAATAAPPGGEPIVTLPLREADFPRTAAALGEIVQVTPAQENGRLVGYRLNPGSNLKEFARLGLQPNDIVVEVNGVPLDDAASLPRLYALLNEATEVSFSLLREGEPLTRRILLDAPR